MASAVLDSLPLVLVAAGLALLGASLRIARLARGYRLRMEKLLQLASRPIDPLELPAVAWPELASGGWSHLGWEGNWFGQPVAGTLGTPAKVRKTSISPRHFELKSGGDVHLRLSLTHSARWGESRLFAEPLARVFVLLLETRLHARTEALSAALAERARLSLYLQHDMRNQAQWVLWVCADLLACAGPDALLTMAHRLRDNAPLASERAERLMAALGKSPTLEAATPIDLHEAIGQAARLAGIEPTIVGTAQAWVAKGLLARALDNLFSNLAAAWRNNPSLPPTLELRTLPVEHMAELDFFCPWPPEAPHLANEKLFEPFASGRPSGLGLGLYQARKSLREAGGDLQAKTTAEGLKFLLRLPLEPNQALNFSIDIPRVPLP